MAPREIGAEERVGLEANRLRGRRGRWSTAGPALIAALLALLCIAATLQVLGGGFLDRESRRFIQHYLSERELSQKIFDVRRNDWGAYQARELSYLVDYLDARFILASLRADWPHFRPLSHYLLIAAIAVLHVVFARRRLPGLPVEILLLLVLLYLTTPTSLFATFYRSSKILTAALLLALVWTGFLGVRRPHPLAVFGLGLALALVDRQGFFFLGALTLLAGALAGVERDRAAAGRLAALVLATAAALGYAHGLAPALIEATNGYRPNVAYLSPDFLVRALRDLGTGEGWAVLLASVGVLPDVASTFFGDFGRGAGMAALALMAWVLFRTGPGDGARRFLPGAVFLAGVALLALLSWAMALRAPFVLRVESRLVYYWLPGQALLLVGATVAAARGLDRWPSARPWLAGGLAALCVANGLALPGHHRNTVYSGSKWTGHERARELLGCVVRAEPTAGRAPLNTQEQALCRFLLRRVDPGWRSGDPEADYQLGRRYARGYGVPRDSLEAVAWFRRAAAAGHPEAQRTLARLRTRER